MRSIIRQHRRRTHACKHRRRARRRALYRRHRTVFARRNLTQRRLCRPRAAISIFLVLKFYKFGFVFFFFSLSLLLQLFKFNKSIQI